MALAVGAPAGFYETVVQRQIMSNRVPPSRAPCPEVRVVIQYELVDVGQHEFALGRTEYGHSYESDVAVLRFGLLGVLAAGADARMEQGHREPGRIDAGRRGRIHGAHGTPSTTDGR